MVAKIIIIATTGAFRVASAVEYRATIAAADGTRSGRRRGEEAAMAEEGSTEQVVAALYAAFLAGNAEGMLAVMDDDVEVRFLGQAELHGKAATRRFLAFAGPLLENLEFRIRKRIVEGSVAAVLWEETTTTASGAPWENHGVDVLEVADGRVVCLHEYNDVRLVHAHFPRYDR